MTAFNLWGWRGQFVFGSFKWVKLRSEEMKIGLVPTQFFPYTASTMKTKDIGSIIQVSFNAEDVRIFNSSFPCSDIPVRDTFFQFEKKTGDLVDMSEHLREVENGSAVSALCDDAKAFARVQFNQFNPQNLWNDSLNLKTVWMRVAVISTNLLSRVFWITETDLRFAIIWTDYGYLHTTGGNVKTWRSYSGVRRVAKNYKPF